jgi:hypothetical protein
VSGVRVLVRPGATIRPHRAIAERLDYPATQVGVTGNVTVSYASSLGPPGLALAQQLLAGAAKPYDDMQTLFATAGGAVEVVVAPLSTGHDGSGGAYHYGCDFSSGGTLYVDATFAATGVDPLSLEIALYIAELSECFMGAQNKGWNCGYSNGEGLSRYCAELATSLQTLQAYATVPAWAQAGFPDWVSKTEHTDGNPVSTGCSVAYIYWMLSLGHTAAQIADAGGATLSDNYKTLTGKTTAYHDLAAAVKGRTTTTDDPFSAA